MQPKKYLIEAVRKLIAEKGIDAIVIQEILDEAHVSRATFYKYFWDKYDLANAYYSEYLKENILPHYDGTNWHDILLETLVFINDNKDYFRQLTDVTIHSFREFLSEYGGKGYRQNYLINTGKTEFSREDQYALDFYNAGCVRVICSWLKEGCIESPEYMRDLILKQMPSVYYTVKQSQVTEALNPYQAHPKEK